MAVRAGAIPTVAEVMTRDVYAVAPDTGLATAAELLQRKRITGMPVVDSDGRPIGVVTLADLYDPDRARSNDDGYPLFYRIADGERVGVSGAGEPGRGRVSDMMSPFVLSIESTASLVDAANRMVSEAVHRLLVMDGGALVGIVTMTDLLRGFALLHR
jgi:CBS domain-containing protein